MAITDYNLSASLNTAISGIDISEGCDRANVNNAQRQMMADIAVLASPSGAAIIETADGSTLQDVADDVANLAGLELINQGRAAPDAAFAPILTDFTIIAAADGHAEVAEDILAAFDGNYPRAGIPSGTVTKYVAPFGSDANTGDSWASAYLTFAKIRTVACGEVQFWPGEYALSSWRYNDTNGTYARRFIAPFGGVTFKTSGSAVSGLTFTANATYANVWEATLAATPICHRLLRTDVLDSEGLPLPIPRYTSLIDVNANFYGWYHDTAAGKLYVRIGATNIETSFKANLLGKYVDATFNQFLLYSSISYWENITFEAYLYPVFLTGQASPELWMKNCDIRYAYTHAILLEGGKAYHQGCSAYRCAGDGANYNLGTGSTAAYFIEIDFRTRFAGDEDSYPLQVTTPSAPGAFNKQGSSNHNGIGIRVNGDHDGHAGQMIADVQTSGTRSKSWVLGTRFGRSRAPASSGSAYGYQVQNADAWIEGITVPSSANGAILADGTGIANYFNIRGAQSVAGTGTFVAYTPTT